MPERSTVIADYLMQYEGASRSAARAAGQDIAARWDDREFWLAATLAPLETAKRRSPDWHRPARDVVTRLALACGVHIHDCPAYTPKNTDGRTLRRPTC
ncbi:MAG TPA: hypothetical protein VG674_32000 [Amycolatopsis sp.]|nr:hypothetical protein [Amycolatopsis sp.]